LAYGHCYSIYPEPSNAINYEDVMSIKIYHNPRCSKSRNSLALLQETGADPEIIEYLNCPPDAATIIQLARSLGQPVSALLRRGEEEFRQARDLPELDDDDALAAWLSLHPRVIERPIVVSADGDRAVIGRPPENVLELADS
jgi:arsenate reductase